MAAPRSTAISQMLDDLKTGKISKGELFTKLSRLQHTPTPDSTVRSEAVPSPGALSHSGRKAVSVKDWDRGTPPRPPSSGKKTDPSIISSTSHRNNKENGRSVDYWQQRTGGTSATGLMAATSKRRTAVDVRLERDAECTFRPKITKLPKSYASDRDYERQEFTDRVMMWKKQKRDEMQRRQEESALNELEGCSFQPSINESSRRLNASVSGRLDSSARGTTDKKQVVDPKAVSDRLYNATAHRQAKERARILAQQRREAEFQKECTFRPKTNRSKVPTPVRARYMDSTLSARKRSPTRRGGRRGEPMPTGTEECTFRPKTNSIQPGMDSAQMYLRANCFERLSQPKQSDMVPPRPPSGGKKKKKKKGARGDPRSGSGAGAVDVEEPPVMDMSSFMANLAQQQKESGAAGDDSTKAPRLMGNSAAVRAAEKARKVQGFLERQRQSDTRRQRRLENARRRQMQGHHPKICAKSADIVASRGAGNASFLSRMEQHSRQMKSKKMKKLRRTQAQSECSFHPEINERSRIRKPRSVDEMSAGDALRRETTHRLMKMKSEQQALAGLTFRPKTNTGSSLAPQAEGRLKILSDPGTYLKRVQRDASIYNERTRRAAQENDMAEFAECTFHPRVHDAPAYIKRIARSMSLSRAARAAAEAAKGEKKDERPGWR